MKKIIFFILFIIIVDYTLSFTKTFKGIILQNDSITPIINAHVIINITNDSGTQYIDTVSTDNDGLYYFNTYHTIQSYIIQPFKTYYSFTPNIITGGVVSPADTVVNNFIGERLTHTISGNALTQNDQGIENTKIIITGADSFNTTIDTIITDNNGYYTFNGITDYSYDITPFKNNYTFIPSDTTISQLTTDTTINFIGTMDTITISGIITNQDSQGIPYVQLTITGSKNYSLTTDTNGVYSFKGNYGDSYTITPSKDNYTFTPLSTTLSNITNDTTINFQGTKVKVNISGTIYLKIDSVTPVPNVRIIIEENNSSDTIFTNNNGYFSYSANSNTQYSITPEKYGYTFEPSQQTINLTIEDENINFYATNNIIYISGYVMDEKTNTARKQVKIYLSGDKYDTTQTNDNGYFVFEVLPNNSYNIQPEAIGFIFTPEKYELSNIISDTTLYFLSNMLTPTPVYPIMQTETSPNTRLYWYSQGFDSSTIFQVKYYINSNPSDSIIINNIKDTSVSIEGLNQGIYYNWAVRAIITNNDTTNWSDVQSFLTKNVKDTLYITPLTNSVANKNILLLLHDWNSSIKCADPAQDKWSNFETFFNNDFKLSETFDIYYVNYYSNFISIPNLSELLKKRIEALDKTDSVFAEKELYIIGQGIGGLIARYFMNEQSSYGNWNNQEYGNRVKILITLGTPHIGTPMANGPARDAIINISRKNSIALYEQQIFSYNRYDDLNRKEIYWLNSDNLLDYISYNEQNQSLSTLNNNTTFDNKIITYSGNIAGINNISNIFSTGAYIIKEDMNLNSDGLVPTNSATFENHNIKNSYIFNEYNHDEICAGKSTNDSLFNYIKKNLLDNIPMTVLSPKENYAIEYNSNFPIKWTASDNISKIDIEYSLDNKNSFTTIATNIDATLDSFVWNIPDTNSFDCYIKISSGNDIAYSKKFVIYHNRIIISNPSQYSIWSKKEQYTIEWNYTGVIKNVKIDYIDTDTSRKKTLFTIPIEDLYKDWDISSNIPISNHAILKFNIISYDSIYTYFNNSSDSVFISDTFKIYPEKELTIIAPNSEVTNFDGIKGEKLYIDSTYDIEWKVQGYIKNINLYLVSEQTSYLIEKNIENDTTQFSANKYQWHIPNKPANNWHIKIEDVMDTNINSTSTYSFRINYAPPNIIYPAENEQEVNITPQFTWNKCSFATGYNIEIYNKSSNKLIYQKSNIEDSSYQYPQNDPSIELENNTEYYIMICAIYNVNNKNKLYYQMGDNHYKKSYYAKINFKTENAPPVEKPILLEPENQTELTVNNVTFKWTRPKGTQKFILNITYGNNTKVSTYTLNKTDTTKTILFDDDSLTNDSIYWTVTTQNNVGSITSDTSSFKILKKEHIIGDLICSANWSKTNDGKYKGTGNIIISTKDKKNKIKIYNGYIIVNQSFTKIEQIQGTIEFYIKNKSKHIAKGNFNISGTNIMPTSNTYLLFNPGNISKYNLLLRYINLTTYKIYLSVRNNQITIPATGITIYDKQSLYFKFNSDITINQNGDLNTSYISNTSIKIGGMKFILSNISLKGDINYAWIQSSTVNLPKISNPFFTIANPIKFNAPMIFTFNGSKIGFGEIVGNTIKTVEALFPSIKAGALELLAPYFSFKNIKGEWKLTGSAIIILPFNNKLRPKAKGWKKSIRAALIINCTITNRHPYINNASIRMVGAEIPITPMLSFQGFYANLKMEAYNSKKLKKLFFKGNVVVGIGQGMVATLISGTGGIEYKYEYNKKSRKYFKQFTIFGQLKALMFITLGDARISISDSKWNSKSSFYMGSIKIKFKSYSKRTTLKASARITFPSMKHHWVDIGMYGGLRITKTKTKIYFNSKKPTYTTYSNKIDYYLKGYGKIYIPKHAVTVLKIKWPKKNKTIANMKLALGKFKINKNYYSGIQGKVVINSFRYPKKVKCRGKWWKPYTWNCKIKWKTKKVKIRVFVYLKKKKLSLGSNFYKLKEFRRTVALRRLKAQYNLKKSIAVQNYFYNEDGDSIFFNIPKTNDSSIIVSMRQFSNKRPKLVLSSPDGTLYYSEDYIQSNPEALGDSGYIMQIEAEQGTWKAFVFDIDKKDDYELTTLGINTPPTITINNAICSDSIVSIDYQAFDKEDSANVQFFYTNVDTAVGTPINDSLIAEHDGIDNFTWDISNLKNGNYYIYAIIDDGNNAEVKSNIVGPIHIQYNYTPKPPESYQVIKDSSYITISWDIIDKAEYYTLYLGQNQNELSDTITDITSNSYQFQPLSDTQTYYFRLRSYSINDSASEISQLFTFKIDTLTIDTIPPDIPNITNVNAIINDTSSYIKIKWNKVQDAAGYIIAYKKTVQNNKISQTITVDNIDSLKIEGLEKGNDYEFSIASYDENNNISDYSQTTTLQYYNLDDTDEDGMLDFFETKYFGDITATDDKNGDFDDDGLSNIYELDTLHTNPNDYDTDDDKVWDDVDKNPNSNYDSDGDMLPDDWELYYQVTNANKDNDYDGLKNLDEYKNGTDPRDSDTDGGGRGDGDEIIRNLDPLNKQDDFADTPVYTDIKNFNAIRVNNKIIISWESYNDSLLKGFYIYKSSNNNSSWLQLNSDIITITNDSLDFHYFEFIDSLAIDSSEGYKYQLIAYNLYDNSDTVGYTEISAITDINENINNKLKKLSLYQNYPNPFNGITQISYFIPTQYNNFKVSLNIYNLLGQRIIKLVDQTQATGKYTINWNAKDRQNKRIKTGVYIYELKVGNTIIKKKMIYLK